MFDLEHAAMTRLAQLEKKQRLRASQGLCSRHATPSNLRLSPSLPRASRVPRSVLLRQGMFLVTAIRYVSAQLCQYFWGGPVWWGFLQDLVGRGIRAGAVEEISARQSGLYDPCLPKETTSADTLDRIWKTWYLSSFRPGRPVTSTTHCPWAEPQVSGTPIVQLDRYPKYCSIVSLFAGPEWLLLLFTLIISPCFARSHLPNGRGAPWR